MRDKHPKTITPKLIQHTINNNGENLIYNAMTLDGVDYLFYLTNE